MVNELNDTVPTIQLPAGVISINENSTQFKLDDVTSTVTLSASDSDQLPANFRWEIVNDPVGLFSLSSTTTPMTDLLVNLSNLSRLDFETLQAGFPTEPAGHLDPSLSYVITVRVYDDAQDPRNSSDIQVPVRIDDIFESASPSLWHEESGVFTQVVDGGTYDTGSHTAGTPATKTLSGTFYVINHGNEPLTIDSSSVTAPFSSSGPATAPPVAAGGFEGFTILLDTTQDIGAISRSATLTFGNGINTDYTFTLEAEISATAPEIEVFVDGVRLAEGAVLDFGTTQINQTITRQVTIRNTGTADLTIDPVTDPSGFDWTTDTQITIPIGSTQTFDLVMTAVAAGIFVEQLILPTDDPQIPNFTLNLTAQVIDPVNTGSNPVWIIDNEDPQGFSTTGEWTIKNNAGFESDIRVSLDNNGMGSAGSATWNFQNLSTGLYRVSTTWDFNEADFTGDIFAVAPFSVFNGNDTTGTLLDTVNLNQHRYYGYPDDFVEFVDSAAVPWEDIGTFFVDASELTVTLHSTDESLFNHVVADAVRIELLQPSPDVVIIPADHNQLTFDPLANDGFPRTPGGSNQVWQIDPQSITNPNVSLNLDGTLSYTFSGSLTFDQFDYRLMTTQGMNDLFTESTTVSVYRTTTSTVYSDDLFSTSHRRPITFDVRGNDLLLESSSAAPSFTEVANGRFSQVSAGQWNVYDNGFYVTKNLSTVTLSVGTESFTVNGGFVGLETRLNQEFANRGVPYVARTVDTNAGVLKLPANQDKGYVQLFNLPDSGYQIASDGTIDNDILRGTLQINSDHTATYVPDTEFFKLFGQYQEKLRYTYSETEPQTTPGAIATIVVGNDVPTVEAPTHVLVEHDASEFTRRYYNVPLHAGDVDGDTLEVVRANVSPLFSANTKVNIHDGVVQNLHFLTSR